MKVKNRLLDTDLIIYQDDDWFKFSLDSVLLVRFVTLNLSSKNIIDLCCGNAPIPMFLSFITKANIFGIELQECIYNLGFKSIKENKLEDRINLKCGDIKNIDKYYDSESFDTVICNPPYFNTSSDKHLNNNDIKAIARHEIMLDLDGLFKTVFYLLKNGGNFAMIHRTERLIEILDILKKYRLEPKKIQFIYPKNNKNSDLFMIEVKKNGNSGLKVLPSIIVHNDDGSYTDSVKEMLRF